MADMAQHRTKMHHAADHGEQAGQPATQEDVGTSRGTSLQESPMMAHLLDALQAGKDIGHFGRLTFVMVARFFLPEAEIVGLLEKQPGMDKTHAEALVLEVKAHDYNPPRRQQILQWQRQQDFPICPNADDPRSCNVYDELQFPESVYHHITEFYEQQIEAREHDQSS